MVQTFGSCDTKGKSSDLALGFHCFAVDVIMDICYAKNWDATKVPDFQSDIVLASQAVLPILTMHKYSGPLLKMMRYIPMRFGKNFGTPVTKALFLLREVSILPKARVAIETFPHRRYWTRLTKSYVTQAAWKMRPIKSFIIRCWVAMPKEDDYSLR